MEQVVHIKVKPRLRIVGKRAIPIEHVQRAIRRRKLVVRACLLFPVLSLRKKWVRAAERVDDIKRSPRVVIGIATAADPVDFIRRLGGL